MKIADRPDTEWRRRARFVVVGASAFVLGAALLQLLISLGMSAYAAQFPTFWAGASYTWLCNRRFTFAVAAPPAAAEYVRYLLSSAGGFAVSIGTCSALLAAGFEAIAALAGGTVAGLFFNYVSYVRFAFNRR